MAEFQQHFGRIAFSNRNTDPVSAEIIINIVLYQEFGQLPSAKFDFDS